MVIHARSSTQTATARQSTLRVEEGTGEHAPLLSTSVEPGVEPDGRLLLIKVTGYRLLTTTIIVTFGSVKAIQSLNGRSVTATWLDWVLGVILSSALYWLGFYADVQPQVAVWFFHRDLAFHVLCLLITVVGGVIFFACFWFALTPSTRVFIFVFDKCMSAMEDVIMVVPAMIILVTTVAHLAMIGTFIMIWMAYGLVIGFASCSAILIYKAMLVSMKCIIGRD